MLEKTNSQRVLELLFIYPNKNFHVRGLSRELGISPPTVISVLKVLKKKNLVTIEKNGAMNIIKPSVENENFIRKKRLFNISSLYESGIIDYLVEKYRNPKAIISFGSYSRGEDAEKSDIDIAIISKDSLELPLEKFEKILKRKINIHEIDLDKVSPEFKDNLINGIILEGAL